MVEERTQAAQIDALTCLATRAAFLTGLEHTVLAAASSQQVAAVLCLDLDGFKPVNDSFGHAVGDEVLGETGRRIKANCRDSDLAARIGGDEFAVLLVSSHRAALSEIRDRLLAALHETFVTSAGPVRIGASCGMAVVSGGDLAESVLARADAAMYADKRTRHEQTASH